MKAAKMGKVNLSEVLNDAQYEAVTTVDGPLLVLAGAGSGKTRVITYRVYHLIEDLGVPPVRILGVTFTNKAAGEMKERIVNLVGDDARFVNLMTFHSLGSKILRETAHLIGIDNNFTIFDQDDQKNVVKEVLKELGLSREYYDPGSVVHMIGLFKNEGKLPEDLYGDELDRNIIEIYRKYEEFLRRNNALDFGDLLLRTYLLFNEKPSILQFYQETFNYIMVDEFQDTNFIQYELVKMLSQTHRNICVVGDEDQTIYSWRGAEPDNVFQFVRDFKDARVIKLEENYRSSGKILEVANTLIKNNKKRMGKKLWTNNPPGEYPTVTTHIDEMREAQWVVSTIEKLLEYGYGEDEIAIFYRMNYQSRVIEEELVRRGIPYQVVGSLKFYDRRETKDILAYLRVILNPREDLSLQRIINTPPRGIGKKSVEVLKEVALQENLSLWEALEFIIQQGHPLARKFLPFYSLISSLREEAAELDVYQLALQLITDIEYEEYLYSRDSQEAEGRMANVAELLNSMKTYVENEENPTLQGYLERVALISDIDTMKEGKAVSLMTLHASKGLEFPVVFIVGLNDGLLPHARSQNSEEELEEERRLLYVGITRAKERLFLSLTQMRRTYNGIQEFSPSMFLRELPPVVGGLHRLRGGTNFRSTGNDDGAAEGVGKVIDSGEKLQKGKVINHPKWGKGVIRDVSGDRVRIIFGGVGEKLLAREFVERFLSDG